MNNKIYNLTITILLITISVMGWKIYDLKQVSAKYQQFSIETGIDCVENSKNMTQEEIEYCLPVMQLLGFEFKPENDD